MPHGFIPWTLFLFSTTYWLQPLRLSLGSSPPTPAPNMAEALGTDKVLPRPPYQPLLQDPGSISGNDMDLKGASA